MNTTKKVLSVILLMLSIFFILPGTLWSLPMTRTIYTIPKESLTLRTAVEIWQIEDTYQKETLSLGFGLLPRLSLWLSVEYLHEGAFQFSHNNPGDTTFSLWYYLGDFCEDHLHMGLEVAWRIPTGADIRTETRWRSLSLGKHELAFLLAVQIDVAPHLFFHLNGGYTFREGSNESFWSGFAINPLAAETYKKLFGLNPAEEGAFLYYGRLKNDYLTFAWAVNSDIIYPFIPFVEIYGSLRPYRGTIDEAALPIEGGGVDPLLIGTGGRYFFRENIFLGFYCIVNPLWNDGYIKLRGGIDFSVTF